MQKLTNLPPIIFPKNPHQKLILSLPIRDNSRDMQLYLSYPTREFHLERKFIYLVIVAVEFLHYFAHELVLVLAVWGWVVDLLVVFVDLELAVF